MTVILPKQTLAAKKKKKKSSLKLKLMNYKHIQKQIKIYTITSMGLQQQKIACGYYTW